MAGLHSIPLAQVISDQRPADTIIALRGKEILRLSDFRRLTLALIHKIERTPHARWAFCFNDSYHFSAALLAALYCNRTPIIPGHLREAVLKEQSAEYDALLTDLTLALDCPTINISDIDANAAERHALPAWPDPDSLTLFTSGSTGKPKPIVKSIALLELESQLLINRFGPRLQNGHIASTVSHQHLYGLTFRILLPLLSGRPFDANQIEYHEQLQRYPTESLVLVASPAFLKRLDPQLTPVPCRLIFSAGGPLSFDEAQKVKRALSVLPQEIYGTSETGIIATRAQSAPELIWSPFSGIRIGQNADGSIKIDSPLFNSNENDTVSDLIRLEADGFHLAGRKDRIVKIEEKRISLTEIERRLTQLPEIADASVVTLPQDNRTIIGAIVVLSAHGKRQAASLSEAQITRQFRQILRNWLEPVALPKRWRIVDAIPQNSQGKRTYIELQELFL